MTDQSAPTRITGSGMRARLSLRVGSRERRGEWASIVGATAPTVTVASNGGVRRFGRGVHGRPDPVGLGSRPTGVCPDVGNHGRSAPDRARARLGRGVMSGSVGRLGGGPRPGPLARVPPAAPRCRAGDLAARGDQLSLIHISEPTRRTPISYAVFCL